MPLKPDPKHASTDDMTDDHVCVRWRAQVEMRGIRSRALAMVKALREATDNLSREHKSAHAILEAKFRQLEESVDPEWAAEAA